MEQKKILLIAISVGVFLVIAIGAAVLVFGSGNALPGMVSGRVIPVGRPLTSQPPLPAGILSSPESGGSGTPLATPAVPDSQALDGAAGGTLPGSVLSENEVNSTPAASGITLVNDEKAQANAVDAGTPIPANPAGTQGQANSSTTISVTRPSTAAVPDVPPVSRQAAPVRTASPPAASSPARTSPAAQSVPRTYDDFWVQTGSFSTIARAENVKEVLSAKGISSIIENRIIDDTTYYRVRVGPYISKNEADYWLSLIKSINGFEDSQIWQSSSTR